MNYQAIDLHERVLREPDTYPIGDRTAKAPSELAAEYRREWLRFYDECATFRADLHHFHETAYLPARPYWTDATVMDEAGYDTALWDNTQFLRSFGEISQELPELRVDNVGEPLPHPAALGNYLSRMGKFCLRWGLDRLYSVDTAVLTTRAAKDRKIRKALFAAAHPDGPEEVHSWCEFEALGGAVFGGTRTSAHFRPTLGDPVLYEIDGPGGERVVVRDATNIPRIEIALTDSWDPREETLVEAELRILERVKTQQVRPRLGSIQARVIQAEREGGVAKHDTRSKLSQHMAWAFMREALGCTYLEVERKHEAWAGKHVPEASIKRAVYRLAPHLGLRRKD